MPFLLLLIISFLQAEVPLKSNTDFEVKLDYKFKARPGVKPDTYSSSGNKIRTEESGVLPYLIVNFKVLKLDSAEMRIRIISNTDATVFNRKTSINDVYPIDFGFMADVKDRVSANTYTVFFLTEKKVQVSKAVINIDQEGNFFVNNEKRGKL